MPAITVRDIPAETRDELAARAAAAGQSLQEYLRAALIGLTERPDPRVWAERVRERKRRTGTRLGSGSILSHRDAERP